MTNLDTKTMTISDITQNMSLAIAREDTDAFEQAIRDLQDITLRDAKEFTKEYGDQQIAQLDSSILASRGIHQLTREENDYYQKLITAAKSNNYKQEINDLDVVLPKTVYQSVFEELEAEHPLLGLIDFQATAYLVEFIMNDHEVQFATWDPICADITKELESSFKKKDVHQNKLSAFVPICKAMLDLGPEWLDRYIRTILRSAVSYTLEDTIIDGRGTNDNLFEPIGMTRDLSKPVDPQNGYERKAAVPVSSFDPASYGELLFGLAQTDKGNPRRIGGVVLIVSVEDYFRKVMPATTVMTSNGTYASNVFPFPTTVVQSVVLKPGEAVIGIPSRYFFALGTERGGRIEYSDEYKFLEDIRIYLIKLYGFGMPKDNTSFQVLDISGLQPAAISVRVSNPDEFPGGANEGSGDLGV